MRDGSVRAAGLFKLVIGGLISLALLGWITSGNQPSAEGGTFKLILLSLPLVVTFMGLLEVMSGVPFSRFGEAWDALHGWQRGVFGILIVIIAIPLLMGLMIALFA